MVKRYVRTGLLVRDVVEALYGHRGTGSTTVCAEAAKRSGAVLVVQSSDERKRILHEFGRDVFTVTISELPRKLRGRRDPLIFDPHTVAALFATIDDDFDRMRRRLVVKWLKTRRRYLHKKAKIYDMLGQEEKVEKCDRWASFYWRVSRAIERGEPLEYFSRLGQDK